VIAQQNVPPSNDRTFRIDKATPADTADLHTLIAGLAEYERLTEICVATQHDLDAALFGEHRCAEALIARVDTNLQEAAGFALFFHTYSTFLGRRSLWLEDLFVRPEHRRRGLGRRFLETLAALAVERNCGRFEWSVLDWNTPAIRFYESLGASLLTDWRIARVTGNALPRLAGNALSVAFEDRSSHA
jgi:GNAT superfamily N-acetyltransferase